MCFSVQLLVRLHESSKLLSRQSPGGSTDNISTTHNCLLVNDVNSDDSVVDSSIETTDLGGTFINIEFTSVDYGLKSVDVNRKVSADSQCTTAPAAAAASSGNYEDRSSSDAVNDSAVLLTHYKVTAYFLLPTNLLSFFVRVKLILIG